MGSCRSVGLCLHDLSPSRLCCCIVIMCSQSRRSLDVQGNILLLSSCLSGMGLSKGCSDSTQRKTVSQSSVHVSWHPSPVQAHALKLILGKTTSRTLTTFSHILKGKLQPDLTCTKCSFSSCRLLSAGHLLLCLPNHLQTQLHVYRKSTFDDSYACRSSPSAL